MNYDYIQEHPVEEVDVVSAEQVDIEEAEMDEMWSFVHDRSQQYWLWRAIITRPAFLWLIMREHRNLDELRTLPAPFHINTVYADGNYAYKSRITESAVVPGKKNTQCMECRHLSLRTWCSRLVRKTLYFSKLHLIHDIVVGLVIHCRLFGRAFPFQLIYVLPMPERPVGESRSIFRFVAERPCRASLLFCLLQFPRPVRPAKSGG